MAEIKIQKKSTPIWPWLLGLLLLVLAALFIFYPDNEVEEQVAMADDLEETYVVDNELEPVVITPEIPAEVNAFLMFADEEQNYTEGEMGIHHKYTGSAIRYMADAIVVLAENRGMTDEIDAINLHNKLDNHADQIQKNWKSGEHADIIRVALMEVSSAINTLASDDIYVNLRSEAKDIDPSTLTLNQKQDVKSFIDQTAAVMEKMAKAK